MGCNGNIRRRRWRTMSVRWLNGLERSLQFTHAFANNGFHRLDVTLQKVALRQACSGLFARSNEIFRIVFFFVVFAWPLLTESQIASSCLLLCPDLTATYPGPLFLNRRAAARYRAMASIIPGRERLSWNLSF